MKTKYCLLMALLAACGCSALKNDQLTDKETIFGLNAVTPGASGMAMKLQIGLVRHAFAKNPTSASSIYAAPITSRVHADVSATHQIADEIITMGSTTAPVLETNAPTVLAPAMPAPQLRPLVQTQ